MQAPGQGAHKLSFALRRAVSAMVRFVLLFVIFHLVTTTLLFCVLFTVHTDWLNCLNCFGTFCSNICLGGDVHHDLCGVCGHGPQPNHEHPSKQWWHVVVGFFPAAFCWLCFFDSLFFSFSPHSLFLHSPFLNCYLFTSQICYITSPKWPPCLYKHVLKYGFLDDRKFLFMIYYMTQFFFTRFCVKNR